MQYYSKTFSATSCMAEISGFEPCVREHDDVAEYHVMLHVSPSVGGFPEQLSAVHVALRELLLNPLLEKTTMVFKRYFVRDIANQSDFDITFAPCATSIIQQPPLDGSEVALWLCLQSGVEAYSETGTNACSDSEISHNGYKHFWTAGKQIPSGSTFDQSENLLRNYSQMLNEKGCTLKDNCVRTWFFIKDIDVNYIEFALARKRYFSQNGLTENSHYIASTGIEGRKSSADAIVSMDAYSLQGAEREQFKYLYARSHLSPTYDYGVTFERGVSVRYGDRQHMFISGTASIDNCGNVLHPGDIKAQTFRMWENVEALLNESEANLGDIAQIIVYLKNSEDYTTVRDLFNERFASVPTVITIAAVCRPAWLIEMECIAINNKGDVRFRNL